MSKPSDTADTSATISASELKFLLQLLLFPDYRAPLSEIRPTPKATASDRDRLYQQLRQRGLVDGEERVSRFTLTAAGRTLLTLDTSILPITPDERWVLRSSNGDSITPGQIHARVPTDRRHRLITTLAQRGLIKITQQQVEAAWLTAEGQRFLREDCAPQGHTPVVSWTMLSGYLQFMRQQSSVVNGAEPVVSEEVTPDDVLHLIRHLDEIHQTENYLPIYYLREKLQPPLSRKGLDQQLYQLQREDRIDLSTLQDVTQYPKVAIAAGIPQDIGGPLFFISVV